MAEATVCVVVLNYGQWEATCRCLDALWAMDRVPDLVLVCDNASPDDSVSRIRGHAASLGREEDGRFRVVENPANNGYASGNNTGIRLGLDAGCDFIWILNNDAYPEPGALRELLACAESQPRAGIIGATLVNADDPGIIQSAGGCQYAPWTTILSANHAGQRVGDVSSLSDMRMDYVAGASMFCRRAVFQDIGMLSEDFFLFYEEIDLCRRAQKAGYELLWCRNATVRHEGGLSVGRPGEDRARTARANYHENLSTLVFTKKHHPMLLPVSMSVRFLGKLYTICISSRWYLLRPLLRAYGDFFAGRR